MDRTVVIVYSEGTEPVAKRNEAAFIAVGITPMMLKTPEGVSRTSKIVTMLPDTLAPGTTVILLAADAFPGESAKDLLTMPLSEGTVWALQSKVATLGTYSTRLGIGDLSREEKARPMYLTDALIFPVGAPLLTAWGVLAHGHPTENDELLFNRAAHAAGAQAVQGIPGAELFNGYRQYAGPLVCFRTMYDRAAEWYDGKTSTNVHETPEDTGEAKPKKIKKPRGEDVAAPPAAQ